MGGCFCSLDQLYKKFSGNTVFPSPEIEVIFPRNQVKTKKKGLGRNLRPFSAGNLQNLLVLAGCFSSGHAALNSRWGDATI